MSEAIITHPVTLNHSTDDGTTFEELVEVKNYPNLSTPAEGLDKTTLKDLQVTLKKGIKGQEPMEFTCNFNQSDYDALVALEGEEGIYQLDFGTDGEDGSFSWTGEHEVTLPSGDNNSVVDMTLTIYPSSEVKPTDDWEFPLE
ncbi:MAG: hypothetical protein ACOCQD_01520 [archaeon]